MNNYDKLYQFLIDYTNKYSYPPSVREIGKYMSFTSTSTTAYYLKLLEKDKKIIRNPYKNRSIEICELKNKTATRSIPILGQIAAGLPILAEQNQEGEIVFSDNLFHGNNLFILRVKGDSMINVGIFNNDFVVVNKQNTASNGEIVAALIEDEATVKRFYKEPNAIRLQPENSLMRPIYTNNVEILGKVVGVIRSI